MIASPTTLAAFWTPGPMEMVILLVIALLLFGRRLPEVGKSLGKGIVEFRRGLKGVTDEIEEESGKLSTPPARSSAARPPLPSGGSDPRIARDANPYRPADAPGESQSAQVGERPGA